MALTDSEQRELLENSRYAAGQLRPWPQLGQNAEGQDLTLVDAFAQVKGWVEYLRGQLGPWPQLGQNDRGQDLTPVDGLAATRHDIADVRQAVESLEAQLEVISAALGTGSVEK